MLIKVIDVYHGRTSFNDRKKNGITSIIEFLIFSISDALMTVYKDTDDTFPPIHLQSGNSRLHSKSWKKI
jgi:hypothetical protein